MPETTTSQDLAQTQSVDAPGEPSSHNTCGQFPAEEVAATFEQPTPPAK